MRGLYVRRYLYESTLSLSFVGQQTVEHMDLFPVQPSSCTFPLGGRKRESGDVGEESILYRSTDQDTFTPLLLKSKGLSVGSFLWAPFQVCLGPLPGVGSEV